MEGIILQTSLTPNQTSTVTAYGSVLQPSGLEREKLRIYYSLLLGVFTIVVLTFISIIIESLFYLFFMVEKKVGKDFWTFVR
jgi:hypothetical protein